MKCHRCGLPILSGVVSLSALHCRCFTHYTPRQNDTPPQDGCQPFRALTEADVRRIVRQMLAEAEANRPSSDNA